jgi:hypothetical protein
MKSKIKSILSAFIMTGALLLSSCAKDGETGPTGATGAAVPMVMRMLKVTSLP